MQPLSTCWPCSGQPRCCEGSPPQRLTAPPLPHTGGDVSHVQESRKSPAGSTAKRCDLRCPERGIGSQQYFLLLRTNKSRARSSENSPQPFAHVAVPSQPPTTPVGPYGEKPLLPASSDILLQGDKANKARFGDATKHGAFLGAVPPQQFISTSFSPQDHLSPSEHIPLHAAVPQQV